MYPQVYAHIYTTRIGIEPREGTAKIKSEMRDIDSGEGGIFTREPIRKEDIQLAGSRG